MKQNKWVVGLGLTLPTALWGATNASGELEWLQLGMGLVGGLALFLYGMETISQALRVIAGDRMKDILAKLSNNRIMGLFTGAVITAVLQSSSITTVLLVSFVSAGLMSLPQSLGIILGANIGTTITAQIIAFKVTKLAMVMVAAGVLLDMIGNKDHVKQIGRALLGLGLIFWGMSVMSDAMRPLRSYQPFVDLMAQMANPFLGLMTAAAFTALVQSSSATMGIVIALASQGLIPLEGGIALILGANVGTCVTAVLASLGQPPEARQVAAAHTFFNLTWSVALLPAIPWIAWLVGEITPPVPGGDPAAMNILPRQLANAHTLFNVGMAVVFIGLTTPVGLVIRRFIPPRPRSERQPTLDPVLLKTPSLALDVVRLKVLKLGRLVEEIYGSTLSAVYSGTTEDLRQLESRDKEVDALHATLMTDLSLLSQLTFTDKQTDELLQIASAANELESIGDLVENVFTMLGLERLHQGIQLSPEAQSKLVEAHGFTLEALNQALNALATHDAALAQQVLDLKRDGKRRIARVVLDDPHQGIQRLQSFRFESDLAEGLRRVFYHTRRLSKPIARAGVAASDPVPQL